MSDKKAKVLHTPRTEEERQKFLQEAIDSIEKAYGKGAIMKMDGESVESVEVIPTGCLTLDIALGIGGMPRGRIVEIYGPESSGKTTLALHAIAQAQKMNLQCAFIDAEHAFDPKYGENLGINLKELYVSQPDSGEQALDIAEQLVRSGSMGLIVVDSVAALTPKAEIDGEMGASNVGLQARLMSSALRKLTGVIKKSNACLIFINQLRQKVGVIYGSAEVTTGGTALKFYSSIRIDVRKKEAIKTKDEQVGNETQVRIVKNKLAPPYKTAKFDIIFGKGINKAGCIFDVAVEYSVVAKSGSWFSYMDNKIGQGRDNAIAFLEVNPEIMDEITGKVIDKMNAKGRKDGESK